MSDTMTLDQMLVAANNTMLVTDRCDACSAQAQVRFEMPAKNTLDFCAHHASKFEAALIGQGANIKVDSRSMLK